MSETEWDQLSIPENETEGNPSSEMKNPLLIDVVLDVIFKHLKVEDLKQCRIVCSLWNSSVLASSSWKQEVKVNVSSDSRLGEKVEAFTELVEVGNGICFSETFSIETSAIPLSFWSQCGTWIKILRLRRVKFESKDDFRTVVCKACPNMEQLSLCCIQIPASENDRAEELESNEFSEPKFGEQKNMKYLAVTPFKESEGILWMELLRHFPNLEALHIHCINEKYSFSGFFDLLSKFRKKFPAKLNLKHISIKTYRDPYPGFFQILKDPGLQLHTINTNHCCEPDDLREVLSMHAPYLKKIRFWFTPKRTIGMDPHQIFPLQSVKVRYYVLDGLQVLEVQSRRSCKPFLSLAILKYTPNLRMFKLTGTDDAIIANTQLSEMEGVSLKMCKRLILHFECNMSLESMKKLVTWLPNVEELELSRLTNDHFQMICESWPGLVALVLGQAAVDDTGITGLDKEDVDRINMNGESSSWRPITVPRANISAIRDLRSLRIENRVYGAVQIGYCAVIHGIELLPKLERLSVLPYILRGSIWERLQSRYPKAEIHLKELEDFSYAFWV